MNDWIFAMAATIGTALVTWAAVVNPNADRNPDYRDPRPRVTHGPYRYMKHPIYIGEWLMIAGTAGLAAGWWCAVSLSLLASLLFRDWTDREHS